MKAPDVKIWSDCNTIAVLLAHSSMNGMFSAAEVWMPLRTRISLNVPPNPPSPDAPLSETTTMRVLLSSPTDRDSTSS